MKNNGETVARGEFDIDVSNKAVQSISFVQKFPSQLTFTVVTIVAVDLALVPAAGVVCGIQGFVSKIPKVIAGSGGLLSALG